MISLLIYLLVLLIVFGVLCYIIDLIGLPGNITRIAKLILALILLLIVLNMAFNFSSLHTPLFR